MTRGAAGGEGGEKSHAEESVAVRAAVWDVGGAEEGKNFKFNYCIICTRYFNRTQALWQK